MLASHLVPWAVLGSGAELLGTGPPNQTHRSLGPTSSCGPRRATGRRTVAGRRREDGRGWRPHPGLGGAAPAPATARPRLPWPAAHALSPIASPGAQRVAPRPVASVPAGQRSLSPRHDHPANSAPGPGTLGLPPRGGQGLRAASRHFPGKNNLGREGSRALPAWGATWPAGDLGRLGPGERCRRRRFQELGTELGPRAHPGAPGALAWSAFRASRARAPSSPFPAAALRGEPGGGRARTRQIREIEGSSWSSFAPEARPGVWTRFVKRRGFGGPRGFRTLGNRSSTSRFFTSRRVAESRLEAPWTTWKGRWSGGVWGASGINFKHTTETTRFPLFGSQPRPGLISLISFWRKGESLETIKPGQILLDIPLPLQEVAMAMAIFLLSIPGLSTDQPFPHRDT